jgi:hypothetical protein
MENYHVFKNEKVTTSVFMVNSFWVLLYMGKIEAEVSITLGHWDWVREY